MEHGHGQRSKDTISMISFDPYLSPGESQKEAHSHIHKLLLGLSGGLWTSGRASWVSKEFTNPRIRSPGKEHISLGWWHEHPAGGTDARDGTRDETGRSGHHTEEPVGQQEPMGQGEKTRLRLG